MKHLTSAVGAMLLLFAAGAAADAGGIRLSPLRLEMSATETATALSVGNDESVERRFQVQVQRWTQRDGIDELLPADEVIANPPMFVLAPGRTQTVRIGFVDAAPEHVERAYRVFVREVPVSAAPVAGGTPVGVQILRRFSLPLYRAPAAPARRALHWSAYRDGGDYVLTAHNLGNVHERRADMTVYADEAALGRGSGLNDLLPGAARTWRFSATLPAERLRIEAISDRQSDPLVEFAAVR